MSDKRDARGFALPMVLIVLALLTVMSMGLSHMARSKLNDAQLRRDIFENELAMKDAVQGLLYQFLIGTPDKRVFDVAGQKVPIDGSTIQRNGLEIQVQDVAGLLGLPFYQEQRFSALFAMLMNKQDASLLSARLGDWIDRDQVTRYGGMEVMGYVKSGLPMRPRNAPLRSLDELLELPGMRVELYNGNDTRPGLRDLLMAGGEDHFNIATAPAMLIGPALGVSEAVSARVLELREQGKWTQLEHLVRGNPIFGGDYSFFTPGHQFRVIVHHSGKSSLRAVFILLPLAKVPYRVILWQYPDHERG